MPKKKTKKPVEWFANDKEKIAKLKKIFDEIRDNLPSYLEVVAEADRRIKSGEGYTIKAEDLREQLNKLLPNEKNNELPMREDLENKFKKFGGLLDEIIKEEKKKETVKRGAFLSRQINKYNYPEGKQLSIFDLLEPRTQQKVIKSGVSMEFINRKGETLPLNKGHYKLIDCICELLHEKSQNNKPSSENYYSGNEPSRTIIFGGEETKAPALLLTLYEIAKKYNKNENPSGKHINIVKSLIADIAYKPKLLALIKYERKEKTSRGTIIKRKIEEYAPLWRILDTSYEEYNEEETKILKRGSEVVLLLNPIFRDQISNIWVEYPKNLVKRSLDAYGSPNPPEIFYRLREYLAEHRSRKNLSVEITKERLFYRIAEKYMKEKRKGLIEKYLKTSLESLLKLGLLKSWKLDVAKTGEPKYIFQIEKDWI